MGASAWPNLPFAFEERRPAEDVGVGRPKHQRVATTPTLNATAKTLAPIACFTSKIISSRCGLRKTKWWLAQGKRLLGRFWLRSVNAGNRIFFAASGFKNVGSREP
jgi:hypothetical protein